MRKSRAQSEQIFKAVGKLVVSWNDLELHVRRLLFALCDDWFTSAVLTADMQISNLLDVLRIFAAEHDVDSTKLNKFNSAAREKLGPRARYRDMVSEHVGRAADIGHVLRNYRNLYAHGVNSPIRGRSYYSLGGMTARNKKRLVVYDHPLRVSQIKKVTRLITSTVRYIDKVEQSVRANKENIKLHYAVKWPTKPDIPPAFEKASKPLNEHIPLL
jgi:hypothetical protein